jgi:thiamine biosynthesis lipoprotein
LVSRIEGTVTDPAFHNRRDFLTGRLVRAAAERTGQQLADELQSQRIPSRGATLLLRTVAMACDFDVMLNPLGPADQLNAASDALELVHELEQMLSVYRVDSNLSELNRRAPLGSVEVDSTLFMLLRQAQTISELTEGAFDPLSGALVSLWRQCRQSSSIPTNDEVACALAACGTRRATLDEASQSIQFDRGGVEYNLGAIGKGYAVDRAGELLDNRGVSDWLVHGGRSSVKARGRHNELDGWPVGLRNPLLPDKPFATLLLRDQALGTSGTAVQWFRHEGKRYGHILDPRTGWPVESMMSVSVIAPDAALADALSTAFFVLGVENARRCCDNFPSVGAIFFPPPRQGQTLAPVFHNVPADRVFFE